MEHSVLMQREMGELRLPQRLWPVVVPSLELGMRKGSVMQRSARGVRCTHPHTHRHLTQCVSSSQVTCKSGQKVTGCTHGRPDDVGDGCVTKMR